MRHRKQGRKFGRTREQRNAFVQSLVRALVLEGQIMTTEARAKELKRHIDPLITKVKKGEPVTLERQLAKKYAPDVIAGLKDISKRSAKRTSGYTMMKSIKMNRKSQTKFKKPKPKPRPKLISQRLISQLKRKPWRRL